MKNDPSVMCRTHGALSQHLAMCVLALVFFIPSMVRTGPAVARPYPQLFPGVVSDILQEEGWTPGGDEANNKRTATPETQVTTQQVMEAMGDPLQQTWPPPSEGQSQNMWGQGQGTLVKDPFRMGEGLANNDMQRGEPKDEYNETNVENEAIKDLLSDKMGSKNIANITVPEAEYIYNNTNGLAGIGEIKLPMGDPDSNKTANKTSLLPEGSQMEIAEMEKSMEKIKSALAQLEFDIAQKKKANGKGIDQNQASELLTNLTGLSGQAGEPSSIIWQDKSNGYPSPDVKEPANSTYSQAISEMGANETQTYEAESYGADMSSSYDYQDSESNKTATIWKWNIQNDTNYSKPLEGADLKQGVAAGVPLGKVCILLNGTVVKDMEEGDCKSQAGLHYMYIPSRLRNNGTRMNSSGEPLMNTAAFGDDMEQYDGAEPQEQGSEWEDAQWDLYKETLRGNGSLVGNGLLNNNTAEGEEFLGMNPLGGPLLNISETVANPFEPQMNRTRPFNTSTDIWHAGQEATALPGPEVGEISKEVFPSVIDNLFPEYHGDGNNSETSSQVFGAEDNGHEQNPLLSNNSSSSNNASSFQDQGISQGQSQGQIQGQLTGMGNGSSLQGIPGALHINGSEQDNVKNATQGFVGFENMDNERNNVSGISSVEGQWTENSTIIKGDRYQQSADKDSKPEPNSKFIQEPKPSTEKPYSVHVYKKHYPPHAIQGLIWEDRRYMASVLVPVACGMAGAFLIVCLAYLSRHCREQPKLKPKPNVPQQLPHFDRVMLLADSSDDDF